MGARLLRIAAIAAGFLLVFSLSQQATAARSGGEVLPGLSWAIGILSVLFLVGAYAAERMRGPEENLSKDLLWGLGVGGLAIILHRL
jgi:hypothetical protein